MNQNQEEVEILVDKLLDHVEEYLELNKEFYPFGGALDENHCFHPISYWNQEKSTEELVSIMYDDMKDVFNQNKSYQSVGFCVDVTLKMESKVTNAVQLNVINRNSNQWVTFYLPYEVLDAEIKFGSYIM